MTKSLLLFDTDHIKRYVFATDKLREIRAASAILDRLNRQTMPHLAGSGPDRIIFANGGSGLFVVETAQLEAIKQAVKAAYREKTSLASVTGVEVEAPASLAPGSQISPQLELLGYRLRAAKEGQGGTKTLLTHAYLNFCSSCGLEYAEEPDVEDNEPVLVCRSCKTKRDDDKRIKKTIADTVEEVIAGQGFEKEKGIWPYLITQLHKSGYGYLAGYDRPDTFTDLAQLSSPSGYIGLIYADGDAMGRHIGNIDTLARMKNFAQAVDDSIYEATVEAICTYLKPRPGQAFWPFDILLVGGDDLVMVTRAESALEVGLRVMQRFTALAHQKYGENYPDGEPLHLSVGVAIAHDNYPFGQLLHLAESALKFAKEQAAYRRQRGASPEGLLNFLVISSANHLEFGDFYKEQLLDKAEFKDEVKKLYRSLRPYTATEFEKLIGAVRRLKQLNTPRTKLEQLRALLFQSKRQAMVDSLSLLFHWREEGQRAALQEIVADFKPEGAEQGLQFPWFQAGERSFTPLLDLIEIYDFVGKEEGADEPGY